MAKKSFPQKVLGESTMPLSPKNSLENVQKRNGKNTEFGIIAFLTMANFFIWITTSCSTPFFALEATEKKGQTIGQVGLCNGISQLFMGLFAPICGKYMALLPDYRVNSLGLSLFSFSTFCFGFCNFVAPGWQFFFAVLFARILGGVGICAIITGGWAILGRLFPERVSMLRGIGETVNGIGFSLGPLLGSLLYEIGGFPLPLMVTGSLIGAMAAFSFALPKLIEKLERRRGVNEEEICGDKKNEENERKEENELGIFKMLKMPNVFVCICCLLLMSIGWFFYEPSLAVHLSTFSPPRSATEIASLMGWMMTALSAFYALFAPFWGFLFERHFVRCQTSIMLIGSIGISISLLLMGPSPFLALSKSVPLLFASFLFNGIFSAILYVPMFRWCQEAVKANGFDEKCSATNGLIAGIHHSVFSFGAFLGTSLGGFSAQIFGFEWTATGVAALQMCCIFLQFFVAFTMRKGKKNENIENK